MMETEQLLYTIVLLYYTREHYSIQLLNTIVQQIKVITPLSIIYFCTTTKIANLTIFDVQVRQLAIKILIDSGVGFKDSKGKNKVILTILLEIMYSVIEKA